MQIVAMFAFLATTIKGIGCILDGIADLFTFDLVGILKALGKLAGCYILAYVFACLWAGYDFPQIIQEFVAHCLELF